MRFRALFILLTTLILTGCSFFSRENKTGLQVMTNDIPTSIFINGQFISQTPSLDKSLPPGQYSLRLVPEDSKYASFETTITLRAGLLTVVTWKPGTSAETSGGVIYEMQPLDDQSKTELAFQSIPENAILTLDDREKEVIPITVSDIEPGNHTFEVSLPSYQTQNHTLNVVQGYTMVVRIFLAKTTNDLYTTESPLEATVSGELQLKTASASSTGSTSAVKNAIGSVKISATDFFVNNEEVLKVRKEADAASPEIGTVKVDEVYPLLRETDEWFYISFDTNKGWISKRYAQKQ